MPKRKRKRKQTKSLPIPTTPTPSGECIDGTCSCQPPPGTDLTLYFNGDPNGTPGSVQKQSAYKDMPARGPLNQTNVIHALVEDYLAHSKTSEHLKSKQVRLREALRRVSSKLSMDFLCTLNTKTTPFRLFGNALWLGCGLAPPKHKAQVLHQQQKANKDRVEQVLDELASYAHYNSARTSLNSWVNQMHISDNQKNACQRALDVDGDGIYCLRALVPEQLCLHLMSKVRGFTERLTPKVTHRLTETCAQGSSGVYYDTDFNEKGLLSEIQRQIFCETGLNGGHGEGVLPGTNDKAVLLVYTEGGENWSHQDDNREFHYQALMMLSEPGVDFTGGEFYVLSDAAKEGVWIKKAVVFENRGDVVLFRSNGKYFHGMNVVSTGTSAVCHRVAVGLLHKQKG